MNQMNNYLIYIYIYIEWGYKLILTKCTLMILQNLVYNNAAKVTYQLNFIIKKIFVYLKFPK